MADVSIVLPCLNERQALGHCVGVARQALAVLKARHGLTGEIVVADNGSTDGSQDLATVLGRARGARCQRRLRRGTARRLRGGAGRFLVMGDADGSYDFREAVPMVEALLAAPTSAWARASRAASCRARCRGRTAISATRS